MRQIDLTTQFKRDYRRELKGQHKKYLSDSFEKFLEILANDNPIPSRYSDHPLTGNWKDFRDCHLKPDLILIYKKIEKNSLILVRLGSHSELGL
jgi:mRNA interferase YafQ